MIKASMVIFLCFFTTLGKGQDQKKDVGNAISYLSDLVAEKYQLSTTGYQGSMFKGNKRLTEKRSLQYSTKAKETFPMETLKNLGILQKNYVNRLPETDELSDPHHMNEGQLTSLLMRFRGIRFGNCEEQALEVGMHLWVLGLKNFSIISNKGISHNYIYIPPTNLFPSGAIVDSWSGFPLREFNTSLKILYKHVDSNIMVVQNMMDWIQKNADKFANKDWITDIEKKFFPGKGKEPLNKLLIPVE
jgi:hypothetical protein